MENITVIYDIPPRTAFDLFIEFDLEPYDEVGDTGAAPPNSEFEQLRKWLSYTFGNNFVLLQRATRIVAGGAFDLKRAYDEGWDRESTWARTDSYQLRCSNEDATLFLLTYAKGHTLQ